MRGLFFIRIFRIVGVLLVLTPPCFGAKGRKAGDPESTSVTRGVFSAGIFYGATSPRLLNADGSLTTFRGTEVGLLLDVSAMLGAPSDFRFFIEGGSNTNQNVDNSAETLTGTRFLAGMKAFPTSFFYVAAGIGRLNTTYQTATASSSLTSPITALGLGIEVNVLGDLYAGFNLWYRSGVLRYSENTALPGNSFTDTMDAALVLIWCPASSVNIYRASKY